MGPIYRSPESSPALCPVCLCYSCLVLSKLMYLPSSVSRLGSFWIPPSVLWFGNCFRVINWDNLVTRFIICLSDQNPMLPIMQYLNTIISTIVSSVLIKTGCCIWFMLLKYSQKQSVFLSFFFSFFFPSSPPPLFPLIIIIFFFSFF